MAVKKYYYKWKAAGMCVECGIEPAVYNRVRCYDCLRLDPTHRDLVARRLYFKRHRLKRKDAGLCISCSAPLHSDTDEGRVTCLNCRLGLHKRDLQLYPKEITNANNPNKSTGPLQCDPDWG